MMISRHTVAGGRTVRADLAAWVGGGVVWGLVMAAAHGWPAGVTLGAVLALALHRAAGPPHGA